MAATLGLHSTIWPGLVFAISLDGCRGLLLVNISTTVYANKFRVKIESVVDDFFSQRDGFKQSGGILQNII